ncbi:polysaccharide deacetylase family protein [Kribbella qitaiheensis]|uniref:Polysaccharide deacetylase family protein n=2 Tax=Kribbella qitaiheensis TaxID=1544730 RepID=A0A7G6XAT6_9ACTN|nr:polysaccharide deacetylase family protein [Kribbella qitaiheensis]
MESEAATRPQAVKTSTSAEQPAEKPQPTADPTADPTVDPTADPSRSAAGAKVVYLTFDDGPDPAWTPQILDLLASNGAKATFFELGQMVARHPELHDAVLAGGNAIGSHSYSHPQLTMISAAKRHREITGGPESKCFRPPYGAVNAQVRAEIKAAGMKPVLWDTDSLDWTKPGSGAIVANVLKTVHSGSVVLMHDAGGNRSETVAALEKLLPILTAKGYTFAALDC